MNEIKFQNILDARERVYKYLHKTPLHYYPGLSKLLEAEVHVKHENHHQVGAFKVRGGVNLISTLSEDEKKRGVICATRGNHGQSVAFASHKFGVKSVIIVPFGNNPEKNQAMKDLGAELIEYGKDFDEAKVKVIQLIGKYGYRYIKTGDEPKLIEGVGTYALEIHDELPDPDFIFVPIGLGSGISGNCIVAEAKNSKVELIGCQALEAPAVGKSIISKDWIKTETANTIADGLATREPEELPLKIMRKRVSDVVFLSEAEIREGVKMFLQYTHNLAEGAAGAALFAAYKWKNRIKNKKVVVVLTGSNIDNKSLKTILSEKSILN